MGLEVWREVTDLTQQALTAEGFRPWGRATYYLDLNPETEGLILLSRADERGRSPDVHVGVSVGVRNGAVASLLDEIVGERRRRRFEASLEKMGRWQRRKLEEEWCQDGWEHGKEPTIIQSLCDLKPGKHYKVWHFREGRNHAPRLREMLTEVRTYGLPFMEKHASLEAVAEALTDMQHSDAHRLAYQAPIAYYLLGQHSKARELLVQEIARTDTWLRQHPGAAEDPDYRHYVAEMLQRIEQGSGPRPR